jgi:hypothetical protein
VGTNAIISNIRACVLRNVVEACEIITGGFEMEPI